MRDFSWSSHVQATPPYDHRRVTSWLKTLLVLALLVPMTAHVAGSLSSSGADAPSDRGPVIIDNPNSPVPERPRRTRDTSVLTPPDGGRKDDSVVLVATPTPSPADNGDNDPQDDHSAHVVTPAPTPVDVIDPVDEDEDTGGDRDEDDAATDGDKDADDDRGDEDDSDDDDGEQVDSSGTSGTSGSSGSSGSND